LEPAAVCSSADPTSSHAGWRRSPRRRAVALTLLASIAIAGRTPAQTPDAGTPVEWIRPEEIPARADALLRLLDTAGPDAKTESSFAEVERALPDLGRELDAVLARAADSISRSAGPTELEDIGRELMGAAAPLAGWRDELTAESKRVAELLDAVARAERVWSATRGRPETAAAGDVMVRRVERSLEALDAAGARLRAWRARVLGMSDQVIGRIAVVDSTSTQLRSASTQERASLLVPDRPPLWSRGWGGEIRRELPHLPHAIREYAEATATYVERDPRPLVVQALVAALLMLVLGRFSSHALERLAGDEAAARAARVLERPYAIGLLLALLASPVLHPLAPRRVVQLGAVIGVFPAARIVAHASEHTNPVVFAGLFVLLLLDRLRSALQALPALERTTFLLSLTVAFALAAWVSQRAAHGPWPRRAARVAMGGLALALLADVGGWTYLATLLGRGIVAGTVSALFVYAAVIALSALVGYLLASHTARRSHVLGRNTAVLQRRAERALRWVGAILWLYLLATALALRGAVAGAAAALLGAGISVGALSLSVGGVLAFVLTLVVALLLARVVTAVLEEDVYPRARLPRGVPYAISTLVRYGIYSLGFLFALAAAGVRLDQVAIMLGGLGIGIGLGLQDLVKNFAAGLTLLLERRLHVGDAVEVPGHGIAGRVLSIGTRASLVRTWSGAEVVIPNGDLAAGAITNWTLSDRLCRIEVPVGVAYGTDPERVIALLLDAARSTARLLSEPAPEALFKGFGDDSLDFVVRAWTDEGYDQTLSLTSSLGLAIHRRLREAGIEIPFPQRDVHLESVSPAARAALAGGASSTRRRADDGDPE
jgi:small-conductance mechanosensitive channel